MSKVLELKRARKELVAKLGPLSERTDLTPAEETSFSEMKAQAEALARQIERVEFVDQERGALERLDPVPSRPQPEGTARATGLRDFGYSCLAEFVAELRFEPHADRLRAVVKAQQEMNVGTTGGSVSGARSVRRMSRGPRSASSTSPARTRRSRPIAVPERTGWYRIAAKSASVSIVGMSWGSWAGRSNCSALTGR